MSGWPFDPLRPFSADVINADPPWLVEMYSEKGEGKAPQAHYDCLSIEAISALPVGQLAGSDCWLFLWTSAPLLDRAFEVMRAWDFQYVTRTAWRKTTINDKQAFGPGYIVRTMHEDVLIGKIGNPRRQKPMPRFSPACAVSIPASPRNSTHWRNSSRRSRAGSISSPASPAPAGRHGATRPRSSTGRPRDGPRPPLRTGRAAARLYR